MSKMRKVLLEESILRGKNGTVQTAFWAVILIADSQRHCAYGRCTHGELRRTPEAERRRALLRTAAVQKSVQIQHVPARQNLEHDFSNILPDALPCDYVRPGLHNLEIHAHKSSCARGWSASRVALLLQCMYRYLPTEDDDIEPLLHLNGDVY